MSERMHRTPVHEKPDCQAMHADKSLQRFAWTRLQWLRLPVSGCQIAPPVDAWHAFSCRALTVEVQDLERRVQKAQAAVEGLKAANKDRLSQQVLSVAYRCGVKRCTATATPDSSEHQQTPLLPTTVLLLHPQHWH